MTLEPYGPKSEARSWIDRMSVYRQYLDPYELTYAREQFERCLSVLDARDQARLRRELEQAEAAN